MKHLKTIMSVLAVVFAVSCAKTSSVGSGQVNFSVTNNQQIADMTKSNVSDFTALPSAADFNITVTGADYTWAGKISEWDPTALLKAGNYSVEAYYGSLEEEGFDKPYFIGSQTFAVVDEQVTEVSVPVKLGNTVVKMDYTDNFKNYYKDYTFKFSRGTKNIATFAKDETKAAFIDGWKVTLSGTYVSEIKSYSFTKEYTDLEPATAYTFIFDVNNVGGATLTITFKEGTQTVELGDKELND